MGEESPSPVPAESDDCYRILRNRLLRGDLLVTSCNDIVDEERTAVNSGIAVAGLFKVSAQVRQAVFVSLAYFIAG